MAKKNPIITIPKGMLKKHENLLPLNEEVLKAKSFLTKITPTISMYVTQTGRMFKVNDNNVMEEMTQTHDTYGYVSVSYNDTYGIERKLKVHRAVMGTFDPKPKNEMDNLVVNHKNGKQKDNNDISNLEWLTQKKNIIDAVDQGLIDAISPENIKKVLKLAELGVSDEQICTILKLDMTPGSLLQLRTGQGRYGERLERLGLEPVKFKKYLKEDDYRRIYDLVDEGLSDVEIAEIVNSTPHTVASIRTGKTDYYKEKLHSYNREPVRKLAKITDDVIRYIYKAAQEGKSDEEIAEAIGSGPGTVEAIRSGQKQYIDRVLALGLTPIKTGGKTISDDILRQIIALAKEGKSDKAISAATGVPVASVKTARQGGNVYATRLYNLGLQPVLLHVKHPLTATDIGQIIQLAKEGVSDEELAEKFGRTPKGIQAIRIGQDRYGDLLKRLGLEPVRNSHSTKRKA